MYYVVDITPRGSETFLAGFEDIGEVWDGVSRLIPIRVLGYNSQMRKVRH